MRWLTVPIIMIWMLIFSQGARAEIKNGYESKLKLADAGLRNVDSLLQVGSSRQRVSRKSLKYTKKRRKEILKERSQIYRKYLLTQQLLKKFEAIDPKLYDEINNIRDHEGDVTDIYVKVVDQKEFGDPGIKGTTNLARSDSSRNVYHSEYGDRSVSVKITDTNINRELLLLAHEFGHVKYQVPNLSSYMGYYGDAYLNDTFTSPRKGHLTDDPSNRSVQIALKEYKKSLRTHSRKIKVTGESISDRTASNTE